MIESQIRAEFKEESVRCKVETDSSLKLRDRTLSDRDFKRVVHHTNQTFRFQMRFLNDGLKNLLLYHLYRDGQIKNRFFENPDESIDNLVLNENEAKRYIKLHDQLCCLLSSRMHLTYGIPARSTEIYNLRFKNGSSPRNIYFAFGQIMIVSRSQRLWL